MKQHSDKDKDKSLGSIKKQLTTAHRMMMVILFFLQIVLFLVFLIMMIHYTTFPLPQYFSTPSLMQSPYTETSYVFNMVLYSSFFIQHILMALITFKVGLQSLWSYYPLYQRYIYNIASSVTYFFIFSYARPVDNSSFIVFTAPAFLNYIMSGIGTLFFLVAQFKLGADIFSPYSLSAILEQKCIEVQQYRKSYETGLVSQGIYGLCRHPMQSSVILLLLFSSNIYTVDRLIFISVNCAGIFIGVFYEEKRLRVKFKGYKQYEKKVPYKFLPYII